MFQIISVLLLIIVEKNYSFSLIYKHQENNPSHLFGSTFSNKLGKQYNESEELYFNDTFISTEYKKKIKETEIENMFKKEKQEIHNTYLKYTFDIDNYPFYVALLLDKRNCLTIFIKIIKESNVLFRAFFVKSQYELISINFGYFLFFIGLLFSVNAVFYDENLISKKYHNDITLNDLLIRMILSLVVTCTLFFIYYLTIYCMIYNKTQINWFILAWLSLGIYFSLCVIYTFLFSILKVLSLRYQMKKVYNVLLYIKSSF